MYLSFIHLFVHWFIKFLGMCLSLLCAVMVLLSKEEGVVNFFYLPLSLSSLVYRRLSTSCLPMPLFYQTVSIHSAFNFCFSPLFSPTSISTWECASHFEILLHSGLPLATPLGLTSHSWRSSSGTSALLLSPPIHLLQQLGPIKAALTNQ